MIREIFSKNKNNRLVLPVVLIIIICIILIYTNIQKYHNLALASSPRTIALFLPEENLQEFNNGIRLATKDINKDGGLLGSELNTKIFIRPKAFLNNPIGMLNSILDIGKIISNDNSLLAVISMANSDTATAIADLLQNKEKLLLTAAATDPLLTHSGFSNVFATQSDDEDTAAVIVHHAIQKNLKRFLILGDDSIISRSLVSRFRAELLANGGEIIFQYTAFATLDKRTAEEFKKIVLFIIENNMFHLEDIDAIFMAAGQSQEYAGATRYLRKMHIYQPIYAPSNAQVASNIKAFNEEKISDFFVVSQFDPNFKNKITQDFVNEYMSEYSTLPYQTDEQVYSALKLIVDAINSNHTSNSSVLANYLKAMRFQKPFQAPSGIIAFDDEGRITDTDIFVMEFMNDKFSAVARYVKPFNWQNH